MSELIENKFEKEYLPNKFNLIRFLRLVGANKVSILSIVLFEESLKID